MSFPNPHDKTYTYSHTYTHTHQGEIIFSYSISYLNDWHHELLNHPYKNRDSHPLIPFPMHLTYPVILPWWFYCLNLFQIIISSSTLTFSIYLSGNTDIDFSQGPYFRFSLLQGIFHSPSKSFFFLNLVFKCFWQTKPIFLLYSCLIGKIFTEDTLHFYTCL